jgi:hypothetical protein
MLRQPAAFGFLSLLLFPLSGNCRESKSTAPIDAATIAAYENLGGRYGVCKLRRLNEGTVMAEAQGADAPLAAGDLPAFRFARFPDGKLPAVNVPFGLDFMHSSTTDRDLKQLKGLENLNYLSLRGTQITDEGLAELKDLRTLPQSIYTEQK